MKLFEMVNFVVCQMRQTEGQNIMLLVNSGEHNYVWIEKVNVEIKPSQEKTRKTIPFCIYSSYFVHFSAANEQFVLEV